jgi:hypothetical protein
LRLRLDRGEGASPFADALNKATALVPRNVNWSALAGKATLAAAGDKTWRFCLEAQPGQDLFVEAPAPWWFSAARETASPAGQTCFRVKLEQKPDHKDLPVMARLTVAGGAQAFETTVALGQ